MPTDLSFETCTIATQVVRAEFPDPEGAPRPDGFPLPKFRPTAEWLDRRYESVVIENERLRVRVFPELAGRIVEIVDKAAGIAVLPLPDRVGWSEEEGGYAFGIEWGTSPDRGPEDSCQVQLREATAADEPAVVVLFRLSAGSTLSWHASITLEPGSSVLAIAQSVANRSFHPAPAEAGLTLSCDGAQSAVEGAEAGWLYNPEARSGLYLWGDPGLFSTILPGPGRLTLRRFPLGAILAPRQADTWLARIRPIAGLAAVTGCGPGAALHLSDGGIALQPAETHLNAKVLVELEGGETLESRAALYPERPAEFPASLFTGPIVAVGVQDEMGRRLAVASLERQPAPVPPRSAPAFPADEAQELADAVESEGSLAAAARAAGRVPGLQHAAHLALAYEGFRHGDYVAAGEALDVALGYGAEDGLTWIFRAIADRLAGAQDGDATALANAHFLTPLEPMLRVEAFLSLPQAQGSEPSDLIAPLAQNPSAMADCACLLLEAGLRMEAARWLDECLRHVGAPMLRYLLADQMAEHSAMLAEAADQVRKAESEPWGPPLPWRPIERRAVTRLAHRFPDARRLASLARLAAS